MNGKQRQHATDIEQNAAELLPRNPYCSNEGTPCGCTLPSVTLQPQWPTSSTTIIIHADGKSSHVTCIPGSTPSPAASTQHGPLSILPSTPVSSQSPSTKMSPSALVTMKAATWDHEIIIEDKK
ncbi:uncharacterized protein LOC118928878 isoform X2 [Manis pentadactyla]|uniref:uncharacterized protein LOC118928878 isoform X2 n=1 Tax=Manis pentadactyla TaxID=143292 RepID=UPI00255CEF94|nr:uncharacterized protein LOC118928878 isoform X2 [Manis pentadactyla]